MRLLVVLIFSLSTWAGTYQFHPSSPLYLGGGFDPERLEQAFRPCLEYDGAKSLDGSTSVSTKFSLTLVHSKKELFEQMSLSSAISARYLFIGGSGSVDYLSEHTFYSDSLSWMVIGKSDYGRYAMNNPRLSKEAQSLLDSNLNERFSLMCGTDFVSHERKAVMVAAVFSLHDIAQSQKQKLETSFSASVTTGLFSAQAKMSYASFYAAAEAISRISMTVYAVGGDGISKLADLVIHSNQLNDVQKILQTFMASLSSEKAAPIEYGTGSMTAFGYRPSSMLQNYHRDQVLSELYHRYTESYDVYRRLGAILNQKGQVAYAGISENQYESYRKQHDEYAISLEQMMLSAQECFASIERCSIPKQVTKPVKWPIDAVSECEQYRIRAFELNLISESDLTRMRKYHMAPAFRSVTEGIFAEVFCDAFGIDDS